MSYINVVICINTRIHFINAQYASHTLACAHASALTQCNSLSLNSGFALTISSINQKPSSPMLNFPLSSNSENSNIRLRQTLYKPRR